MVNAPYLLSIGELVCPLTTETKHEVIDHLRFALGGCLDTYPVEDMPVGPKERQVLMRQVLVDDEGVLDERIEALVEVLQFFAPPYTTVVWDGELDVKVTADIEALREDADLIVDDGQRGGEQMPDDFTGLLMHVNDHGNVMAAHYDKGIQKHHHWSVV